MVDMSMSYGQYIVNIAYDLYIESLNSFVVWAIFSLTKGKVHDKI